MALRSKEAPTSGLTFKTRSADDKTMAELMADGADAGDVVIDDVVTLFSDHASRAGIEAEVHAVEHR